MYKDLSASDISFRTFPVYKKWTFTHSEIRPLFGIENVENINGTVNYNGVPKDVLYRSVKHLYYRYGDVSSILNETGLRTSYVSNERYFPSVSEFTLTDESGDLVITADDTTFSVEFPHEICVLSIPQKFVGDGIQPRSFKMTADYISLVDDGFSNLTQESSGEIWGNIFYDRGIVVLTRGVLSGSMMHTYSIDYNSTVNIQEMEVFCTVNPSEFNTSQNPTSLYSGSVVKTEFNDYFLSSSTDPTGSYLAPYITTIGLYDDEYQLVAVGKLATPIKSMHDYPVNFIVRLDL